MQYVYFENDHFYVCDLHVFLQVYYTAILICTQNSKERKKENVNIMHIWFRAPCKRKLLSMEEAPILRAMYILKIFNVRNQTGHRWLFGNIKISE